MSGKMVQTVLNKPKLGRLLKKLPLPENCGCFASERRCQAEQRISSHKRAENVVGSWTAEKAGLDPVKGTVKMHDGLTHL